MNTLNLASLTAHDINWIARHLPKPIVRILQLNPGTVCLAGGAIRALIANEEVNDYDIFVTSEEKAHTVAAQLALEAPNAKPGQSTTELIHKTGNSLTVLGYPINPQIVYRWTFIDVQAVIPSFDFTIARAAFYWSGECGAASVTQPFTPTSPRSVWSIASPSGTRTQAAPCSAC
jgi:hypothetical protein